MISAYLLVDNFTLDRLGILNLPIDYAYRKDDDMHKRYTISRNKKISIKVCRACIRVIGHPIHSGHQISKKFNYLVSPAESPCAWDSDREEVHQSSPVYRIGRTTSPSLAPSLHQSFLEPLVWVGKSCP